MVELLLLKAMRDGDLMEEMITSTTMPRFFPLGEMFPAAISSRRFGADDPAVAKGELPW